MSRLLGITFCAALLLFGACSEPALDEEATVVIIVDDDGSGSPLDAAPSQPTPEPRTGVDPDSDVDPSDDDVVDPADPPNHGWIGGACDAASDCSFADAVCLTEGYPDGSCSQACEGTCPNRDGENSVTFCINAGETGQCVATCDTSLYGFRGCRDGYDCQTRRRFGDPSASTAVCLPAGTPPEPPPTPEPVVPCLDQLDQLGVDYRAWAYTTENADGLACTIDDPIYVSSPINGVTYRYFSQSSPGELAVACDLALALYHFGDVLAQLDVVEVEHMGTFNCRKIGGTNSLSMHGLGLAIDFYGFIDSGGADYILERDWEHDTDNPTSARGQFLYDLAIRMYQARLFNIILTPNFNAAHDNHFHVDLTPGAPFQIGSYRSPYEIGSDCGNG